MIIHYLNKKENLEKSFLSFEIWNSLIPESPVTLTVDGILLAAAPSREDESLAVVKLGVDDDEDDGDEEANKWV